MNYSIASSFDAYQKYIALKLHFNSWEYDFFLFQAKSKNITLKTFQRRTDHIWFEKLHALHSPFQRMLAHYANAGKPFIRNIVQDTETYLDWQSRQDNLTRIFTEETQLLRRVFSENFLYKHGSHPYLVREYLGGRISIETLAIISDITDCVSYWGETLDNDPLFEMVIMRVMKYIPFLDYDHEKYEKILMLRVESLT